VLVAVAVIDGAGVITFHMCVERYISWIGERIFHTLRVWAPEFIREAQVDVVQEPTQVRAIVLGRVEGLNDVLLASFSILGRGRQVSQVNQQVLRPVFQVLGWADFAACLPTHLRM
jgi:hypothetical protein